MKNNTLLVICCILLLITGCAAEQKPFDAPITTFEAGERYLRIDLDGETLGADHVDHINANTTVTFTADEDLPMQLPIYEIIEHVITSKEFQQVQENVKVPEQDPSMQGSSMYGWQLDGNSIVGLFARYGTGTSTMSDEELETMAREVFDKLTFLEGDYVYYGICGRETLEGPEGVQTTRTMVTFCRVLDGARIIGNDRCDMWFNDSGLVAININLFDYEQIGTMDLVPLNEAKDNIDTPDAFTWETDPAVNKLATDLTVDRSSILFVNQLSRGCTVLQPVYNFIGTATLEDGSEAEFSSQVIAIPESYTYEKDDEATVS